MSQGTNSERFAAGMKTRRAVLGDAHVDRANAATTEFDEPFQTFITEGAWGTVWSRPQLAKRERSLITIALLAALGHDEEVAMHVRATANTGASAEEVREALLHVAVYAGVPAANRAFKIVKKTYAEMGVTFLPRAAGEKRAVLSSPVQRSETGEGDHAKHGGGGSGV